jgi:cell cycle protein kinase DBF2
MNPFTVRDTIICNEIFDTSADYWSLGCILYEMLVGYPPFTAATTEEVWLNVFYWQQTLRRPSYNSKDAEFNISDDAWDLIERFEII